MSNPLSAEQAASNHGRGMRIMICGVLLILGAGGFAYASVLLDASLEATHQRLNPNADVIKVLGAVALLFVVLGPITFFTGLAQVITKKNVWAAQRSPSRSDQRVPMPTANNEALRRIGGAWIVFYFLALAYTVATLGANLYFGQIAAVEYMECERSQLELHTYSSSSICDYNGNRQIAEIASGAAWFSLFCSKRA
jgi:hypothetical protein